MTPDAWEPGSSLPEPGGHRWEKEERSYDPQDVNRDHYHHEWSDTH